MILLKSLLLLFKNNADKNVHIEKKQIKQMYQIKKKVKCNLLHVRNSTSMQTEIQDWLIRPYLSSPFWSKFERPHH